MILEVPVTQMPTKVLCEGLHRSTKLPLAFQLSAD